MPETKEIQLTLGLTRSLELWNLQNVLLIQRLVI
uniref:Uncharacterized protein n=1 Tax=Brassica oleracea TaxID=3712 RepID=A0A3P6GV73_BRAOL|nr:unnamed protein product [Brassica oleracea]